MAIKLKDKKYSAHEFISKSIQFLTQDECDFIERYVLKNEENVKKLGPSYYEGTGPDSLTGRYKIFNWLYTPIGKIIVPKLKSLFRDLGIEYPVALQFWANAFHKDERIKTHIHGVNFIAGNIFIAGDEKSGYYKTIGLPFDHKFTQLIQKPGDMCLFPSEMGHTTTKNPSDKVRVSLAMDVHVKKSWEKIRDSNDSNFDEMSNGGIPKMDPDKIEKYKEWKNSIVESYYYDNHRFYIMQNEDEDMERPEYYKELKWIDENP